MKEYSDKISLIENSRGIYGLDTSMGCSSGLNYTPGGCYGDCYAYKSAKQYGYDFSKTVLRRFVNNRHKREVLIQISKVKLEFIRMGCSGDPSENCEHTISILKQIQHINKEIIIITRHWTSLTEKQLQFLRTMNITINTSVSALDNAGLLGSCVEEYKRIKHYCKSILRIISCDFNTKNSVGYNLNVVQRKLFENESTLDTVFRPSKQNKFVVNGIINAKDGIFNGHKAFISKHNKKTYVGKCSTCKEMCGVNINDMDNTHFQRKFIPVQIAMDINS